MIFKKNKKHKKWFFTSMVKSIESNASLRLSMHMHEQLPLRLNMHMHEQLPLKLNMHMHEQLP